MPIFCNKKPCNLVEDDEEEDEDEDKDPVEMIKEEQSAFRRQLLENVIGENKVSSISENKNEK